MNYETGILAEDEILLDKEINHLKYKYKLKKRGVSAFHEAIETKSHTDGISKVGLIIIIQIEKET